MKFAPAKMNVTIHKARKSYVLAQPCVPKALELPDILLSRLQDAERMLVKLDAIDPSLIRQSLIRLDELTPQEQSENAHIASLRHRLGDLSVARCQAADRGIPSRAEAERCALDQRCDALLRSLNQPTSDAFIAELLTLSALVKGLPNAPFRKGGIRLAGDTAGWFWQFPDPQGIGHCLKKLHSVLFRRSLGSAMVEATVAYGILNWMHPFSDGNGRTSRMVFNAILRRAGVTKNHYLPVKEINYLAHGGHEVRLRYTVATGDWKELLEYFVNVATLYQVLLRQVAFPMHAEMRNSKFDFGVIHETIDRI